MSKTFAGQGFEVYLALFRTYLGSPPIGLSKTQIGDLQIVNLPDLRSASIKPKPHQIENTQPWGQAIAISLDGRWVFSLAQDRSLQMWDISTGKPSLLLRRIERQNDSLTNIDLVAQSFSRQWLFLITGDSFDVWDLKQDGSSSISLRWWLRAVSPNGRWALWQSSIRTLRLTNLQTGEVVGILRDYYGDLANCNSIAEISDMPFSRRFLATDLAQKTSEQSSTSEAWKQSNSRIGKLEGCERHSACISADGSTVLIYGSTYLDTWLWQTMLLARWDVRTGIVHEVISDLEGYGQQHGKKELLKQGLLRLQSDEPLTEPPIFTFCADGKKAVFGFESGELKVMDLITKQVIHSLAAHRMKVKDVALSADDQWAVSCSQDQTLKVWHLPSCTQVASFTTDRALYRCWIALVAEGVLFVTATDETNFVNIFRLRLPKDYQLLSQQAEAVSENLEQELEVVTDNSLSTEYWIRRCGIPLPLHLLKDLPDELNSEVGIDYRILRILLRAGRWHEANLETAVLMLEALQCELNVEAIESIKAAEIMEFPRADLLTIDRLWLKYSNGLYGFSLQMRIWEEFRFGFDYFLRLIGRGSHDSLCSCEPLEERRGYFPFIFILTDPLLAASFFIRLARCSGYDWIAKLDADAFQGLPYKPPRLPEKFNLAKSNLDELLENQKWQEASEKTFYILLYDIIVDDPNYANLLKSIDHIWLQSSNQRFGFSVQKRIWEEVDRDLEAFRRRVGWKKLGKYDPTLSNYLPEGYFPRPDEDFPFFPKFDTFFPATVPYNINLVGLPGRMAYITFKIEGSGLVNIRFYRGDHLIFDNQWIVNNGKCLEMLSEPDEPIEICIPLPDDIWEDDLKGSLILKPPQSGQTLSSPFVTFKIRCPINSQNLKEFKKFKTLKEDFSSYRLLEIQKNLLGDDHLDVIKTLVILVERCQKIGCYSESELFDNQIKTILTNWKTLEIGNDKTKVIFFGKINHFEPTRESFQLDY
jgi:WD40 repeat protein